MGWLKPDTKDIKECPTCNALTEDRPTPDGDSICPNCGDLEMMDFEPEDEERRRTLDEIPY